MINSFQGVESWEVGQGVWSRSASSRAALLVREFSDLREEISHHLRRADWERLVACLKRLNQTSEAGGYRSICLGSQSIVELLGHHGAGRDHPGHRVLELCEGLLGHLTHAEWREKEKIDSEWLV